MFKTYDELSSHMIKAHETFPVGEDRHPESNNYKVLEMPDHEKPKKYKYLQTDTRGA